MPNVDDSLGKFSISLAVKDLEASRSFYQKLGFAPEAGDGKTWQVLRNGEATIGLVQGMFDRNILTFTPGWGSDRNALASFTDVRALHARARAAGLATTDETGLDGTGPGSFMLTDPDGNPVLIDQHV